MAKVGIQITNNENGSVETRAMTSRVIIENGKTALFQSTFINYAIKAWNKSPLEIKQ